MSEEAADRTPKEQAVIDEVAARKGREWAERHATLILNQARLIGDLPAEDSDEQPEG